MERPSWDEYFMRMAFMAATRSNCVRRKVGAVIVKEKRIMATGYNGPPRGALHCDEVGCLRDKLNVPSGERRELCRGLHAEQNAIIQAAYNGTAINGSIIYVTTHPCSDCTKMIINSGIKEIIFSEGYPDELSELMLIESSIETRQYDVSQDFKNLLFGSSVELIHKIED
ncbi:MAG: cytidine/deoxycytidylate deaminase family protein [Candidatus Thermoplasmatota archaeon]|jgi:dCMP deaminase|nr:cytidine/deoxycytidylate deaminase family protein [Candidatus Thermoplasmatota archaeon]